MVNRGDCPTMRAHSNAVADSRASPMAFASRTSGQLPTPAGPTTSAAGRGDGVVRPRAARRRWSRALFAARWRLGNGWAGSRRGRVSAPASHRCATGCPRTYVTPSPTSPRRGAVSPRVRDRPTRPRSRSPTTRARRAAPGLGAGRWRRLPRPDGGARQAERPASVRRTWPPSPRSGTPRLPD